MLLIFFSFFFILYYYYYYYYLTEVGLRPGGSSTVEIYTQTAVQYTFTHKQYTQYSSTPHIHTQYSSTAHIHTQTAHTMQRRNVHNNKKKKIQICRPCPDFASYTLAFVLQLRKKHRKPSVRAGKPQLGWRNLSQVSKTSVRVEKPRGREPQLG
jgi:hypothetical protein